MGVHTDDYIIKQIQNWTKNIKQSPATFLCMNFCHRYQPWQARGTLLRLPESTLCLISWHNTDTILCTHDGQGGGGGGGGGGGVSEGIIEN